MSISEKAVASRKFETLREHLRDFWRAGTIGGTAHYALIELLDDCERSVLSLQQHGTCDGCGASVPIEELSVATFPELEGFVCMACKRDTVIVAEKDAQQ